MRILITAGPTREALDPVRFLSNRSSGKMGFALARAAARRGHAVILVSGPVALRTPAGVRRVPVVSADEMLAAVRRRFPRCDALIMAAAVADWRPARAARRKLKKAAGPPVLRLVPTPDILRALAPRKGHRLVVGFAAETGRLLAEARRKLRAKRLDLVVANDVTRRGAGFDVDTNRVVLVTPDGRAAALPLMSKARVARRIVRWVEQRWADRAERHRTP